jgi:general secretion pathway protein K
MRRALARQHGAALLLAMLTVALVASVSAAAYWQQWRSLQLEQTARQRVQSIWLLTGALDWARLILREDARASSNVDHLAEPWAVPLQETRLSSFLAGREASVDDIAADARLSGHIVDEQGKLNFRNLIETSGERVEIDALERAGFGRLFAALGLPPAELVQLQQGLLAAYQPKPTPGAPLRPLRFEQLGALGLSPASLARLARHATWLPEPTLLNLNTASALALHASLPGLDLAQAQSLVAQRERRHFSAIDELRELAPEAGRHLNAQRHGVTSRYFRVHGRLQLDDLLLEQVALVVRNGIRVRVVWRQHGGLQRQDAVLQ